MRPAHFSDLLQLRLKLDSFAIGIDDLAPSSVSEAMDARSSIGARKVALLGQAGVGQLLFESAWRKPRFTRGTRRCEKALREREVCRVGCIAWAGRSGKDKKRDHSWNWPTMTVWQRPPRMARSPSRRQWRTPVRALA